MSAHDSDFYEALVLTNRFLSSELLRNGCPDDALLRAAVAMEREVLHQLLLS